MNQYEIFKNRVVCPWCDGNGTVYKSHIPALKKDVYICDECESTWLNKNYINSSSPCENLVTFLATNGLDYAQTEFKNETYDWHGITTSE